MIEKIEQKEFSQDFPIDSTFFDRLDRFSPEINDRKKIRVFRMCLKDSKVKAFSYAEKTLDYFLHPISSVKEVDKNKKFSPDLALYHDMANLVNIISGGLHVVGVEPAWVKNPHEAVRLMEITALNFMHFVKHWIIKKQLMKTI